MNFTLHSTKITGENFPVIVTGKAHVFAHNSRDFHYLSVGPAVGSPYGSRLDVTPDMEASCDISMYTYSIRRISSRGPVAAAELAQREGGGRMVSPTVTKYPQVL